jgi:hypothetical protein
MNDGKTNRGSLSGMVVCLVMAGISLMGLAYDGGRVVSTYVTMSDAAQNAARLGGQQIVGIRDGNPHVDTASAATAMSAYLIARGMAGGYEMRGTRIQVKVSRQIPMRILGLFGIHHRTIQVVRIVDVVNG